VNETSVRLKNCKEASRRIRTFQQNLHENGGKENERSKNSNHGLIKSKKNEDDAPKLKNLRKQEHQVKELLVQSEENRKRRLAETEGSTRERTSSEH